METGENKNICNLPRVRYFIAIIIFKALEGTYEVSMIVAALQKYVRNLLQGLRVCTAYSEPNKKHSA